jgi:hypothetical protein
MLDTSPGILIPFYDPDIKVLMLSGRGESSVQFYEYHPGQSLMFLVRQSMQNYTNGICILPKRFCDVENIEIITGLRYKFCNERLLVNSVESFSVSVPRLKKTYFQDDIYTLTRDVENALMDVEEWMKSCSKLEAKWTDLNIKKMPLCNENQLF